MRKSKVEKSFAKVITLRRNVTKFAKNLKSRISIKTKKDEDEEDGFSPAKPTEGVFDPIEDQSFLTFLFMRIVRDFNRNPQGEEMFGLTTSDVIAIL